MGKMGFICKSKGEIGSEGSDQKIAKLLQEGIIKWPENTSGGVKTAEACLDRLTIAWKEN